jgi:hypothetical protein
VIRANCRERFTAADFDFVVSTLARSSTDQVSLVDLLSDAVTRDSVLDNPRLVHAILSNAGHLRISSQFYFYVLARHVLQQAGIRDRKLCDYVASLEARASAARSHNAEPIEEYISDMFIALRRHPGTGFLLGVGMSAIIRSSSAEFFTKICSAVACAVVPTSSSMNKSGAQIINSWPPMRRPAAASSIRSLKNWPIDFVMSAVR